MRRERIRKAVDDKIIKRLEVADYDTVRQELYNTILKFREKVYNMVTDQNYILNEEMVETLESSKARSFSYYVLEHEKRFIDLYKVEREFEFGFPPAKNYRLLLFKEKLETPKKSIVSKHFPM